MKTEKFLIKLSDSWAKWPPRYWDSQLKRFTPGENEPSKRFNDRATAERELRIAGGRLHGGRVSIQTVQV